MFQSRTGINKYFCIKDLNNRISKQYTEIILFVLYLVILSTSLRILWKLHKLTWFWWIWCLIIFFSQLSNIFIFFLKWKVYLFETFLDNICKQGIDKKSSFSRHFKILSLNFLRIFPAFLINRSLRGFILVSHQKNRTLTN